MHDFRHPNVQQTFTKASMMLAAVWSHSGMASAHFEKYSLGLPSSTCCCMLKQALPKRLQQSFAMFFQWVHGALVPCWHWHFECWHMMHFLQYSSTSRAMLTQNASWCNLANAFSTPGGQHLSHHDASLGFRNQWDFYGLLTWSRFVRLTFLSIHQYKLWPNCPYLRKDCFRQRVFLRLTDGVCNASKTWFKPASYCWGQMSSSLFTHAPTAES